MSTTTEQTIELDWFPAILGGKPVELSATVDFEVDWSYDLYEGHYHPDDPLARSDYRWYLEDARVVGYPKDGMPLEMRDGDGSPARSVATSPEIEAAFVKYCMDADHFNKPE